MRASAVEQPIDLVERRREIGVPVADDRPPAERGHMQHAGADGFGLAAVRRQPQYENADPGVSRPQPLERLRTSRSRLPSSTRQRLARRDMRRETPENRRRRSRCSSLKQGTTTQTSGIRRNSRDPGAGRRPASINATRPSSVSTRRAPAPRFAAVPGRDAGRRRGGGSTQTLAQRPEDPNRQQARKQMARFDETETGVREAAASSVRVNSGDSGRETDRATENSHGRKGR